MVEDGELLHFSIQLTRSNISTSSSALELRGDRRTQFLLITYEYHEFMLLHLRKVKSIQRYFRPCSDLPMMRFSKHYMTSLHSFITICCYPWRRQDENDTTLPKLQRFMPLSIKGTSDSVGWRTIDAPLPSSRAMTTTIIQIIRDSSNSKSRMFLWRHPKGRGPRPKHRDWLRDKP
jgi:hypothetical protein